MTTPEFDFSALTNDPLLTFDLFLDSDRPFDGLVVQRRIASEQWVVVGAVDDALSSNWCVSCYLFLH